MTRLPARLRPQIALACAAALALPACTTTYNVPTNELEKLDGFRAREVSWAEEIKIAAGGHDTYRRPLRDVEGKVHLVDDGTKVVLFLSPDEAREIATRYRSVDVKGGQFVGLGEGGGRVSLPLQQIDHAGVRKFSLGKTILLVGGIALGAAVALSVIALAAGGGGGSDLDDDDDIFD